LLACSLHFHFHTTQDPNKLLPVKLADFGFAKAVPTKNGCRTLCGTPGYLAPEILERWPAYDTMCDIWSVGVILFLLLGGYLPFDDDDEDKVFDRTRNGEYSFRKQFWSNISAGAKDLISQCLLINPAKRASASEALKHEWMNVKQETYVDVEKVEKVKRLLDVKRKMKAAVNTVSTKHNILDGSVLSANVKTHIRLLLLACFCLLSS
jgi:calcium/calmodulin-dependent protein kinase I